MKQWWGSLLGVYLAGPLAVAAAAPAPPPAASGPKFDIWEFRVLGNHVLPTRSVERAVYQYLGAQRSIDTVKDAEAALERAYKDAGFGAVYVDIPEQDVSEGIVRLQVTEGRVERVRVRGARYFSDGQIRAALPALESDSTPNLQALQQQLAHLNAETPDRVVTPILRAGSAPGTVDVDLGVKDTLPLHGSIQFDNRHTADTTPNRLTASVSYDNLWQRQDSIALEYQTAPTDPENARVESATYTAHAGEDLGTVAFSYMHTSSNVLAVGTLGVLGSGDIYGLHWSQPLSGSAARSQDFTFGWDYKNVNTEVFPGEASASSTPVTAPVHYLNWSVGYSQAARLPSTTLAGSLGVNFGVSGVVNGTQEFANARYLATPSYLYLRLSGMAVQNLPLGLSLSARMSSQWADSPLVNNEQFALGGIDTVRGYLVAEALGDSGAAGTLELRLPRLLGQLYGFGFVDGGVATLLDPLPAQPYRVRLWSTGAGARIDNLAGFSGELDYAIPEVNGPTTPRGDWHVDFSVRYGF
jgi:hemolysin activation/secretion protein